MIPSGDFWVLTEGLVHHLKEEYNLYTNSFCGIYKELSTFVVIEQTLAVKCNYLIFS